MSEKEMIKTLQQWSDYMLRHRNFYVTDDFIARLIIATNGILELYNKEKEKNKSIVYNYEQVVDKLEVANKFKDKIKDYFYNKRTYRQFELQQEYKDFEDDVKLNTIDEIEKDLLEE